MIICTNLFCISEKNLHNSDIPTKQNLYCNGRSTWSVITENADFSNNNNPPKNITNLVPNFIIIGGQEQVISYVMVMDASNSMNTAGRLQAMKDAANRWISYDVEDGTKVGMLPFNEFPFPNLGFALTEVNAESKTMMIEKISKLTTALYTCICDGLVEAAESSIYLNSMEGNAIILLTDGKQTKNCKYSYEDAKKKLILKKIRLITIALGNKADDEIEGLAEATGGKTFFVDDNSGPGDFSDAFTGSTTFQPADTISNTDQTIYQRTWAYNTSNVDSFTVDASLGRKLTFRMEVKNGDTYCNFDMKISIIDPTNNRENITFPCSKSNYGTFIHQIPDDALEGKWVYIVESASQYDSMTISVTSRSRTSSTDPIQTKCWIKTGEQTLGSDVYLKLAAVAEVKQGSKPVIGARVRAYITRPGDGALNPPSEIELLDNGSGTSFFYSIFWNKFLYFNKDLKSNTILTGADVISNDGVYSRYFTKYTGKSESLNLLENYDSS